MFQAPPSPTDSPSLQSLTLTIQSPFCDFPHGSDTPYPKISCQTATLHSPTGDAHHIAIGMIKFHLLSIGPTSMTMYDQCVAFDSAHAPESKVYKVWNFLSNECFDEDKQAHIDAAEAVLFVDQVYIKPEFRRKGLILIAIDELIKQLGADDGMSGRCVVLLQPGPIGSCGGGGNSEMDAAEAGEKIARHWKRMGFEEWSYTDESWLSLASTHRPDIENVMRSQTTD